MVSFEIFVKAMPPSLSELKVLPSFSFAFKIPDNVAASNKYMEYVSITALLVLVLFVIASQVGRVSMDHLLLIH